MIVVVDAPTDKSLPVDDFQGSDSANGQGVDGQEPDASDEL